MSSKKVLILGIGNVLLGDEGIGIHVVNHLAQSSLPLEVECLDGGTGGFVLLEPMQNADKIFLIDATVDNNIIGTVTKLEPKYSRDYPHSLTAHDIGLKDLLDAFYISNRSADIVLYAVTISPPQELTLELSSEIEKIMPFLSEQIKEDVVGYLSLE